MVSLKSIKNKKPWQQPVTTELQSIQDYEKCWDEQNKRNEYGENYAGACEKKKIWEGHNLPAGIPTMAIIEVPDTSYNKWIKLTTIWNPMESFKRSERKQSFQLVYWKWYTLMIEIYFINIRNALSNMFQNHSNV